MRILLTTPQNQYFNVTGFTLRMPAYNLAQLATLLKAEHEIKILDNTINLFCFNEILRAVREFRPEIICFSVPFGAYSNDVLRLAVKIKKIYPGIILVAGGRIPTFRPEVFLTSGFDYIVTGEGEITLNELMKYLSGKGKTDKPLIKGIIYRSEDNKVITNPCRELVEDPDELPFASRELLEKRYSLWGYGDLTLIEASRGCAYNCSFCSQPNYWKRLRVFSNKRILQDMRIIREQGFKELIFIDDSFVADNGCANTPEKIADLFGSMRAEKFDFKFGACLRADTICKNPELIRLGAAAGLLWANVGFESYTSDSLRLMGKGTSKEYNARASEILRRNNIMVWGSHVFAYPKQTDSDLDMTIRYGRKYSDFFRLTMFTPVEGSDLFEKLKDQENSPVKNSDYLNYFNCILQDKRHRRKMMFKFIMGLLSYYFCLKTVSNAVYHENRHVMLMTRRAYAGAVLFVIHSILRKLRPN